MVTSFTDWMDVKTIVFPLSVGSAVAVSFSALSGVAALAAVSSVTPGAMTAYLWQKMRGWTRLLPERKAVWGTVYDADTKRPVPYANVYLLDERNRVLESRVSDHEGRYGFLATPSSLAAQHAVISIRVDAAGYGFPSRTPATIDTFVYGNLYHGERISVAEGALVNFDIPLDPARRAHAPLLMSSPSIAVGSATAAVADTGFWLGLVMVPLSFILSPNPFTFGVLCLYLGTASLRVFGIQERPFGTVTDAATGRAMPFALVTLDDPSGKRAAYAVSDERGRYIAAVPRGAYRMTAYTPASVHPPRRDTRTIEVGKGWITKQLTF